ncbi:putative Cox19-like CHCH family protein [Quillaja saponaria]|uniref:Cox19-like CHCH family protein n=1 Tax=Quillaja saponaria TaxID=32244 RepID=A0AAD7LX06_QUISA|nr:putative Cox19-like CHCH family protein [Quillaja saponaria]
MGGLGPMVVEGMALGTGSAIAHRAVDAVMGPRVVEHENVTKAAATAPHGSMAGSADSEVCGGQSEAFLDCLNHYESEISKCQFHMDMLHEYMPHKHGAALGA